MIHYHHAARRLFNQPLWATRDAADAVSAFLLRRITEGPRAQVSEDDGGTALQAFEETRRPDGSFELHSPRASRFHGEYPVDPDAEGRPKSYRRTPGGTALISVIGELVNRGAWIGARSGLVSYEGLTHQALQCRADPRARNVIVDFETPGGEAVGAQECAAAFRMLAAEKPVFAVVNGMACSAGYALASSCTRIVTIPSGLSAHIGVVMLHLDWSKWLEEEGIKPTFIFVGDHKVDGNPFEPLPESVRTRFKGECDKFYADFVATVVAGRKGLTEEKVRATQALAYKGPDAVALGLADELGTFDDVLAELSRPSGRSSSSKQGGLQMGTPEAKTEAAETAGISAADHDRALKAAADTARVDGEKVGEQKGAEAAKARIGAILGHAEAQGREPLASHFAFKTDMTVDAAVEALKATPKAVAAKPTLTEQMRGEAKPNLGAPLAADAGDAQSNYDKGRAIAMRAKGKKES